MLYVRAGCTHLPSAHCTHRRCRAACAQGPTHCTYWARVPTSGVPHAPCTVAPSGLESPGIERRAVDGGGGHARLGPLGARAHQTQRHVARSGSSGSSMKYAARLRRDRPHLRCPVSGPERARISPPPGMRRSNRNMCRCCDGVGVSARSLHCVTVMHRTWADKTDKALWPRTARQQ